MTVLPQLERDLRDAARKRLQPRARAASEHPHRLRAVLTPLPLVVSILVTLAIAAIALTTLARHSTHPSGTSHPGVQAARRQLIASFAILRRAQTKADLDPTLVPGFLAVLGRRSHPIDRRPGFELVLARWGNPRLDRSLVRVVRLPAWHAKVAFQPATFQPSPSSPRRSEGLELELWTGLARTIPPSTDDGTGPRPTSVASVLGHGLALIGGPDGRVVIVAVPDGVAKVILGPIRLIGPPAKVNAGKFGTVTATVRDNVAAFQVPMLAAVNRRILSGMYGVPAIAQAVWFDARGNVIRHTTTKLDLIIKVSGKGPPRRPPSSRRRLFCKRNPRAC